MTVQFSSPQAVQTAASARRGRPVLSLHRKQAILKEGTSFAIRCQIQIGDVRNGDGSTGERKPEVEGEHCGAVCQPAAPIDDFLGLGTGSAWSHLGNTCVTPGNTCCRQTAALCPLGTPGKACRPQPATPHRWKSDLQPDTSSPGRPAGGPSAREGLPQWETYVNKGLKGKGKTLPIAQLPDLREETKEGL